MNWRPRHHGKTQAKAIGAVVDRSKVLLEVYPGAINDIEAEVQALGGWVCERHPEQPWPHDDCPGPGRPRDA